MRAKIDAVERERARKTPSDGGGLEHSSGRSDARRGRVVLAHKGQRLIARGDRAVEMQVLDLAQDCLELRTRFEAERD